MKRLTFKFLDWLLDERPRAASALLFCMALCVVLVVNYGFALIGYPTSKWVMQALGVI